MSRYLVKSNFGDNFTIEFKSDEEALQYLKGLIDSDIYKTWRLFKLIELVYR